MTSDSPSLTTALRRTLPLALLAVAAALVPEMAGAQAESAAQRDARRPLPVMGQVQIGGVDPAHPFTSRSALATRSRPGRTLASLDLPSLTNVPAAARNVLLAARGFVGTPYVWGGASPGGFDCSGFTRYVFGLTGVAIPRSSRAQLSAGEPVPTRISDLMPGDLLFFATTPSKPISHVAIYAGQGRMIHASGSGRAVRVDDLASSRGGWFATHIVAARRILPVSPASGASQ